MKRIVILSMVLMLLLTACSGSGALQKAEVITVNTAQNDPGYVAGDDYQQNWNDWSSNLGQLSAESADGSVQGAVGTILTISNGGSFHCIVHRGYACYILGTDEPSNKREPEWEHNNPQSEEESE